MLKKTIIPLTVIFMISCAPSRLIKPLEPNKKAVSLSLGGPLIGFAGTTIPIPYTSVSYAQGITKKITAFGSIYPTAALFGNLQTDLGILYEFRKYDSINKFLPGLSITPQMNLIIDKWENKLKGWPQLDANAYWDINRGRHFLYLGIDNWFELASKKAHGENQNNHWIFNPHVGISGQSKKYTSSLELKIIAPIYSNADLVVDYKTPFDKGAIGIYYSIMRRF